MGASGTIYAVSADVDGTLVAKDPARYLMPVAEAIEVIAECVRLGAASPAWEWELV